MGNSSREPKTLVEANRIDYECVSVPAPGRMSVITRFGILGMRAAVHVDDSKRMGSADIHDVNPLLFRGLEKLDPIRREELSRSARRLAARVGFELILPTICVQFSCPRLKRELIDI